MQRTIRVFASVLFFLAVNLMLASQVYAADLSEVDTSGKVDGLLQLIENSANLWAGQLRHYALALFGLLSIITFITTFIPLALRRADISEILAELVNLILMLGFFYAMLVYSVDWGSAIIMSFRKAGAAAAGLGVPVLHPGDIFEIAARMAGAIHNTETGLSVNSLLGVFIASIIVMLCFSYIAGCIFLALVESYIVINASVLFIGFGANRWTREYALSMFRYAMAVGTKLFVLTLIVGVIYQSALTWLSQYDDQVSSMWTMVGLGFICAYLTKQIPEMISSFIAGTTTSSGGHILGNMVSTALTAGLLGGAGVAAGAKIASSFLSSMGGSAGTASGPSSSPPPVSPGPPSGGGAPSGGADPGSTRHPDSVAQTLGQHPEQKYDPPAWVKTSKPSEHTSKSLNESFAPDSAESASSNNSTESSNSSASSTSASSDSTSNSAELSGEQLKDVQAKAAKKYPFGFIKSEQLSKAATNLSKVARAVGPAATNAATNLGKVARVVAPGVVKTAGILAAFSVPGMESSAGLSLGPGRPSYAFKPEQPGTNTSGSGSSPGSTEAEVENTISPVKTKDAKTTETPKTTESVTGKDKTKQTTNKEKEHEKQ